MFGYRLIRDADWQTVQADLATQRGKVESLLRELVEAKASERSKATAADHMTTRLNAVEMEAATLRNKVTGLPTVAPQIQAGPPLRSEAMGASFDLHEDVGDVEAERLRKLGLLHDEEELPAPPSAADLSAQFSST